MAIESLPADIILKLGSIASWLRAIGVAIILWISLQIANWIINRKRLKKLDTLIEKAERIENKLDKLLKKK